MPPTYVSWYSRPMEAKTAFRRGCRFTLAGFAIIGSALLVAGCNEEDAKAQGDAQPASATSNVEEAASPVAEVAPTAAEPAGKASYKEEAFHLVLKAPSSLKAGEPAEFTVILEAQAGFKVNDEYPIKFQFSETAGVTPSKPIVRKEDAKVEKKKAMIPLSVTIKAAGKHKVSGKLSFSVCTDERCLIEKRDLTVDVTAS